MFFFDSSELMHACLYSQLKKKKKRISADLSNNTRIGFGNKGFMAHVFYKI